MKFNFGLAFDFLFGIIPAIFLGAFSTVGLQVFIGFLLGKSSLVSDFSDFYFPVFGFLGCFGIFISVFRFNFRKARYVKTVFLLLGIFVSLKMISEINFTAQSSRSFDDLRSEAFYLWLFLGPCVIASKYIYLQLFKSYPELTS